MEEEDSLTPLDRFKQADARFQGMLKNYQPTSAERDAMASTMNKALMGAFGGSMITGYVVSRLVPTANRLRPVAVLLSSTLGALVCASLGFSKGAVEFVRMPDSKLATEYRHLLELRKRAGLGTPFAFRNLDTRDAVNGRETFPLDSVSTEMGLSVEQERGEAGRGGGWDRYRTPSSSSSAPPPVEMNETKTSRNSYTRELSTWDKIRSETQGSRSAWDDIRSGKPRASQSESLSLPSSGEATDDPLQFNNRPDSFDTNSPEIRENKAPHIITDHVKRNKYGDIIE